MKKSHQTLWEKGPFKILVIFSSVTGISPHFLSDSFETCTDCCIIVRINPIENKENLSNIIGRMPFYLFIFFSFTQLGPLRPFFILAQISCIIININLIKNEDNPSNIIGKGTVLNVD